MSLLFMFLINIVISLVGLLIVDSLVVNVIPDKMMQAYALDYLRVFLTFLPFSAMLYAIDNYLRSCGKGVFCMWVNLFVSCLNIVLNIFFVIIFNFGVTGAALTTSLSMSIGTIISLIPFVRKKLSLQFTKPIIPMKDLWAILYNGSSEFLNKVAGSFIGVLTNSLLLSLGGSVAVASYGIVMYIEGLVISVIFGILDGVQAPVSYNLGKGDYKKTKEIFKLSCYASAFMAIVLILAILLFPNHLIAMFIKSDDIATIEMTKYALFLFAPSYLFSWFNMVTGSFLTSLDKPKESLVLLIFRSIVFPLICLAFLTHQIGLKMIFLTPLVSGFLTFVISVYLWVKTSKKLI